MSVKVKITLPKEFDQMCGFMDVSPTVFLERFVRNILSYEHVDDPDSVEMAFAIRYFLTYSENRNKMYEHQVQIREAFINKMVFNLKCSLPDNTENKSGIVLNRELQEFLADWKEKWKKVNEIWQEDKHIITRDIEQFESISIDTFADIILQKGDGETIRIESKENMAHVIQTVVEGKRLMISTKNDSFDVIPHATIYIAYSTLNGIVVDHSGSIICTEPIECNWLGIVQNGKGNIDLKVDVSSLDATVTKNGNLKISGSAEEAKILNTGPGFFDGINLDTSEAKITIKDSGGISIRVEEELSCNLVGSGDLLFDGEPRIKSMITSGSGNLKHL